MLCTDKYRYLYSSQYYEPACNIHHAYDPECPGITKTTTLYTYGVYHLLSTYYLALYGKQELIHNK